MCDDNARSQPTCCGLPLGRKGLKFCLPSTPSLTVNRSAQSPSCPYACGRALRSERSCSETVDNWEIPGPGPEQLVASECDGMSLQQGQQEGWAYGLIFQHLFPLSSLLSTPHRGACCRCWGSPPCGGGLLQASLAFPEEPEANGFPFQRDRLLPFKWFLLNPLTLPCKRFHALLSDRLV